MSKGAAALLALLLAALPGAPPARPLARQAAAQAPAPEFKIPPEEAKRANPVKPTAASIATGKHVYTTQCAMCHGANGDGKGDLAADMKLTLRDYRDPASLKDMTDGELFYILTKGKGDMPGEEDRMKPEQRWDLINYIRSLAKKK
ncbi:MAG TPA: cytochrome c [Candidatus Acidoferrales bacterium]|jgi:mono/diheme cytochrome c family protein|nr:cytochrome c [Candidatus Acidoferrales bacterium]